jgi:hypothetical protein
MKCKFCENNFTELDLHFKLFSNYNPNVMPNIDKSSPLEVTIDMYLMSVDDVDAKRQTFSIKGFLEFSWKNEFLQWEPEDYPGVTRINVKNSDIWIPDIALQDTFDQITDLGQDGGRADIKNDGTVTIWPYKVYTVACKILIAKFPFDKQTCTFDFLSWTNPSSVLQLRTSQEKLPLDYFSESGEWELLNTSITHERRPYGNDAWDHIIMTFELKRKSLFQILNIMLPVFCISILNITCFMLPSDEGERVTLAISIFLTLAVFLTMINSNMPETSEEVAKFSVYVGLQLFGSACTILVTIISLNLYKKKTNKNIPCFLKYFVKIVCVEEWQNNNIKCHRANELTEEINGNVKHEFTEENGNVTAVEEVNHITPTWEMFSIALDRLCLVFTVFWHVILVIYLMVSIVN